MLGPQDLWVALALGVFFFGSKKLPELSRSLGQAMSEFKKGVTHGAAEEAPPAPPAAAPAAAAPPAADAAEAPAPAHRDG
jgi:TatA/E family protein of Tat protein translocase